MNYDDLRTKGFIEVAPGVWRKPTRQRSASGAGLQMQAPAAEEKPVSRARKQRRVANRQKGKEANTGIGGCYHVGFIFRVSDKRRRDGFGMSETVIDALIRAVRRFREGDSGALMGLFSRAQGWRELKDRNNVAKG